MSLQSDAAAGTFLNLTREIEFTAGGTWSFSCLFYLITLGATKAIFTKRNNTHTFPFQCRFTQYFTSGSAEIDSIGLTTDDGTSAYHWNIDSGAGNVMINETIPNIPILTWTHVGWTVDNDNLIHATTTTVRHYVNGVGYDLVRDPSGGTPAALSDPNCVCSLLGPSSGVTAAHTNGRIQRAAFWNRKLTDNEMADLGGRGFNSKFADPRKYSPVACWECGGGSLLDSIGNNHLVATGGISATDPPPNLGENFAFTGGASGNTVPDRTVVSMAQQTVIAT